LRGGDPSVVEEEMMKKKRNLQRRMQHAQTVNEASASAKDKRKKERMGG